VETEIHLGTACTIRPEVAAAIPELRANQALLIKYW
jgi:hypothetical protein